MLLLSTMTMAPGRVAAWNILPQTLRSVSRSPLSFKFTHNRNLLKHHNVSPIHKLCLFSSNTDTGASEKKRVVFLGTPDVAATTLQAIYEDSKKPDSCYELIGVVTQPPKRKGRKKDELVPSPVADMAKELGIPAMWPEKVS